MVNFAAMRGFHSGRAFWQPISQLQNEVGGLRNGTRVQGVVSQLRNHLRNGSVATKMGVFRRGGFRKAFRSCEMRGGLRNGTRVPKGCFAAAKIFAEVGGGGMGMRNHFAAKARFRSGALGLRNYFATKGHFRRGPF